MKTIEEIRKAFFAIHDYATGRSSRAYMEIPANPERDADLIVSAAIDELMTLRSRTAALEVELRGMCPGCCRGERYTQDGFHESASPAVGRSMCFLPKSAREVLRRPIDNSDQPTLGKAP